MAEGFPGIEQIQLEEAPGSRSVIDLYLIRGDGRSLLIDAGYGSQWSRNQLLAALDNLGIAPEKLDVVLTHKHADHCGLAHMLQQRGATIYLNRREDRHLYDCLYYRQDRSNEGAQQRVLTRCGITAELAPLIWEKYMDINRHLAEPSANWSMVMETFDYQDIQPGQILSYGDYRLEALPLRGHTFGQLGFFDRQKRLLFAADQILNFTTPIVGTSHADEHLLGCYLASVADLAEHYADCAIFPAHEGRIQNLAAVAARIQSAYEKKINQTEACVEVGEQTVWQIAKRVYGLPPAKRSDAAFYNAKMITTKTFSMLEYLHDLGRIQRREENGTLFWWR